MIEFICYTVAALATACAIVLFRRRYRSWRIRCLLPFALVAAGMVQGCGPMIYGHSGGGPNYSFTVVVHNNDVAYAESVSVSWWLGSSVVGQSSVVIPAGGSFAFPMGHVAPDGFELDSAAHPAPYGQVWQSPDYQGYWIFHVEYPSGVTWREFPVS